MPVLFIVFVIAAASYLLGFPVARILARLSAIDKPNGRSSHSIPVVRGGGMAMAGGSVFLVFLGFPLHWGVMSVVLAATLEIGVVSFCDDIKSLGVAIKFASHSVAAVTALAVLNVCDLRLVVDPGGFSWLAGALVWLLGFLWIAGYTNAFNFMDGINGLSPAYDRACCRSRSTSPSERRGFC